MNPSRTPGPSDPFEAVTEAAGHRRILAIDYGTRRMGMAISDQMQIIAQPLEYIPSQPSGRFWDRLRTVLREQEVGRIVVGMPRNLDGSYGPAAKQVQEFVVRLQAAVPVPVVTWDERLTTAQADRMLVQAGVRRSARKTKVDKTAAAILLQSYLDHVSD